MMQKSEKRGIVAFAVIDQFVVVFSHEFRRSIKHNEMSLLVFHELFQAVEGFGILLIIENIVKGVSAIDELVVMLSRDINIRSNIYYS